MYFSSEEKYCKQAAVSLPKINLSIHLSIYLHLYIGVFIAENNKYFFSGII